MTVPVSASAMCECSHHWYVHRESGRTAKSDVCHGWTGSATPGPYEPCRCTGFRPWSGPTDSRTGEPVRPLAMATVPAAPVSGESVSAVRRRLLDASGTEPSGNPALAAAAEAIIQARMRRHHYSTEDEAKVRAMLAIDAMADAQAAIEAAVPHIAAAERERALAVIAGHRHESVTPDDMTGELIIDCACGTEYRTRANSFLEAEHAHWRKILDGQQ